MISLSFKIKVCRCFCFLITLILLSTYTHQRNAPQHFLDSTLFAKAEEGDPAAQYALGLAYIEGLEVTENHALGLNYLTKAMEANFAPAFRLLGDKMLHSKKAGEGYLMASGLYQKAAELGDARAQYLYGKIMHLSSSSVTTENTSVEWLLLSANNNYSPAYVELGHIYEERGNYVRAFDYYLSAQKEDDPEASLALASMYFLGHGTDQDFNVAYKLLVKAASQSLPIAQFNLANMLVKGSLGRIDYARASQLYVLAAKNNFRAAAFALQEHQSTCLSLTSNDEVSIKACTLASAFSNKDVAFRMGELHQNGAIANGGNLMAQAWYIEAACNGHRKARLKVIQNYAYGVGVEKNLIKAYSWSIISKIDENTSNSTTDHEDVISQFIVNFRKNLSFWEEIKSYVGAIKNYQACVQKTSIKQT